jgi:hypothetical protein
VAEGGVASLTPAKNIRADRHVSIRRNQSGRHEQNMTPIVRPAQAYQKPLSQTNALSGFKNNSTNQINR